MRAYNPTYSKSGKRYNKENRLISRSILRSMKSELLSFIKSDDNSIVLNHDSNKYLFIKDNSGRVYCHIPDSVLGDGTYGVACVCQDIVTGQVYCLKVMKDESDPSDEIDMANELYDAGIYGAAAHRAKIRGDQAKQYLYDDINSKYENGLNQIKGSHYAAILPYLEGASLDNYFISETVLEETPEKKLAKNNNPETEIPLNNEYIRTRSRANTFYGPDDNLSEPEIDRPMSPLSFEESNAFLDAIFDPDAINKYEEDFNKIPKHSDSQISVSPDITLEKATDGLHEQIKAAKRSYDTSVQRFKTSEVVKQKEQRRIAAIHAAREKSLRAVKAKDLLGLIDGWLDLATNSANALQPLHDAGYIHCDIKPHNIMYDTVSNSANLCDLGNILHVLREKSGLMHRTLEPQAHGSLLYMASELKSAKRRMDAYSSYYYAVRSIQAYLDCPAVTSELNEKDFLDLEIEGKIRKIVRISRQDKAIDVMKRLGIVEEQAFFEYSDKADIYSLGCTAETVLSHGLLYLSKPNAEFTAADVDSADALLPAKFEASAENKDALQLLEQAVKVMHELQAEDPKARISLASAVTKLQDLKQRTHDLMQQYKITPDIWLKAQKNIAAAISDTKSESEIERFKVSSSEKDKVIIQDHVGTYPTQKIIVTKNGDEIKTTLPKQWFDKQGVLLAPIYQEIILKVHNSIEQAMPGCEMTIRKCKTKPHVAQVIYKIMTEKGIVAHYDIADGTAAAVAALEPPTAGPASPSSQLSQ